MITFDIISETILLEGAFQDKGNQKRGKSTEIWEEKGSMKSLSATKEHL